MKRAFTKLPLIFSLLVASACSSASAPTSTQASGSELPQPSSTSTPSTALEPTEVVFDSDHISSGLTLVTGGDVDTEVVAVGNPQEQAWRSGNGRVLPSLDGNTEQDWYMQFQVDDEVIYQGLPTSHVRIEIEYFDEGTDRFNIQYDAVGGSPPGGHGFTESEAVTKTGTGEFRTAVFSLSDAYFGNRTNGADFRISDWSDGAETIRRVTVTLLTAGAEAGQSSTETTLSTSDDEWASMVFHSGVILTMEDGSTASAIAIKDERILDVGSDAEMLGHAGPDTVVVDLEERTLMPGFVDAHSHVFNGIWRDDLEGGQAYLLSHGITASGEMGVEEFLIQEMQALDQEGRLRMRVSLYLLHVDNCGEVLGDWYVSDYPVSREPGALLQIPGVKLFNDGGSCNLPAVSFEFAGAPGHGDLYFEAAELADMIITIQDNGYQVAIHGLGDRAIEANLDALQVALAGGPNIHHHRIEHNALLRDELLPQYSELDIVPVIFGFFPTCSFIDETGQYRYSTPDEFRYWEWRWRSLIDVNPGVHFAWHSDSPPMGDAIPLQHLHGFVTRREVRDDGSICEPPDWAVDDLLTVEEALEIMTLGSAYALLREDEIGSLKAGKLADLIILSDNPLEGDPDDILDIEVLVTMVGGRVEYCRAGQEAICAGPAPS